MKIALLIALAWSAPGATLVHDTLYRSDGSKAVGDLYITCSRVIAGGQTIVGSTVKATLAAGVLDVSLYANDTATPAGSSCRVQYDLKTDAGKPDPAGSYEEVWAIPTASQVTVGAVRVASRPSPAVMVLRQQVEAAGVPDGYCFTASHGVGSWQPCSGGGGGGGGTSWGSMTSSGWAGMTSSGWGQLTQ